MNRISNRIGSIAPSATMAVSAKAKQLAAAGADVVSFGPGEPDFPTPQHVVEAAAAACRDVQNHRYSATAGHQDLREAVAAATSANSKVDVSPSQVLVTNGGKYAVFAACAALLDPGDEVIVPAPYWVSYPWTIHLAGGVAVPVLADQGTGFQITIDQLERAVTDRTKALIFVSPSNPTGAVYSRTKVQELAEWAAERGIWVIADEIYEHFVYDDAEFSSIASFMEDRWVIVNGVAKAYAMPGWRVGWMVGPPDAIKAATGLQSHSTSNVCNVAQRAALAALTGPQQPVAEFKAAFDRRRRAMYEALSAIDGMECLVPQGAFYAFPSCSGLLGRSLRGRTINDTLEFADLLLEEIQVAVVPGEAFGAPGFVRFSYALSDDDLAKGMQRLANFL
ncbi:MAG: pyridoxal phosphate-dependent aminotransferase [Actinomycetia bacterium]|nr:pyridoxal phosphate-dependent aminotransferase [Actinomycetes bacterium]